jgi:cytochrome c
VNGKILPAQVAVSLDYLPLGYDQIDIASTQHGADMQAFATTGQILLNKNDCKSCHMPDKRSVGPSYLEIAKKYKGKVGAVESLAQKVIKGGAGVWGEHAMSAHPQLSVADSRAIVEYIMTTGEKKATVKSAPVKGSLDIKPAAEQKEKGTYVLRAAYRDKGTASMTPLVGEELILLRHPSLDPELAEMTRGFNRMITPRKTLNMDGNGSYIGYRSIDLTGIATFTVNALGNMRGANAGGTIEIRMDTPDGTLLGKSEAVSATQRGPVTAKIAIPDTKGQHDLYFVFVNPQAKSNQTLMQLTGIDIAAR